MKTGDRQGRPRANNAWDAEAWPRFSRESLPPGRLEAAADFIQRLKRISQVERQAILAQTFGSLPPEDAEAMEKDIQEGFELINEHGCLCGGAGFQRRRASRNRPSRTNIFSRVW